MTKEKKVKDALRTVIDPELGINIVDLGLIYKISVEQENDTIVGIAVQMTLTTPGCPLGGYFIEQVQNAISQEMRIEPEIVRVNIVFDPPWIPDMMKEGMMAELGLD